MSEIMETENTKRTCNGYEYYRDIIACMPNIIYLLDRNCTFTGCNDNFLKLSGFEEQAEIVGKSYTQVMKNTAWPEERIQMLKHDDISVLVSGNAVHDADEAPVFDKEGNIVYYLSTRVPLFDDKKNVIGLVCILTDISERKQLEEQLKKLKEQLQANNAKQGKNLGSSAHIREDKTPPKVLMVEDNTIAQKAGRALLMQLDCHVDVAESGDKAAMLFEPGKYDLVLMDIGLEDTSGYIVSKKIRQMENNTNFHVPIIALTGFEADVVKYDCDDYFMEGALTKPLTSEQAKQIIQHYIYHIDIPVRGLKSIKTSKNTN